MKVRRESLGGKAAVKATILQAHLAWTQKHLGDVAGLAARVDVECAAFTGRSTLSTAWVPLRCLVQIDRPYCVSGAGYYEEALKIMKVPGPVSVQETSCQCAGDRECVFAMSW